MSEKSSACSVKTAFYFSGELLSKTFLEVVDMVFFLVLAKFFKHGLPKLYSTCPEALFAEFFSQNHIKCHCESKNSAGFVRTAFYFSGELLSKTVLEVVDSVFFLVLGRFSKHVLPKLYSTCPEALFADFFYRITLIGTVSEEIQLVLSKLHSNFLGNFWAKQFSFTSPCQILQAWVAKTVFYVSGGTFCGTFFKGSY